MADFAGFGIRGYRSFGDADIVRIGPIDKIHLVVGRNNVGKSNVLRFLHDVAGRIRNGHAGASDLFGHDDDIPQGWTGEHPQSLSLCFRANDVLWNRLRIADRPELQSVFQHESFSRGDDGFVWFDFNFIGVPLEDRANHANQAVKLEPDVEQFRAATSRSGAPDISAFTRLVSSTTSSDDAANVTSYISAVAPWNFLPQLQWVGAIRELTHVSKQVAGQPALSELLKDGRGLIPALAQLEKPLPGTRHIDRPKFDALQALVRDVLDDPQAEVEIPRAETTITVVTGSGRALGLESLGTGVSEIIMLAAVATALDSHLICIEEPELHLHPALQRKLIQYLDQNTSNTYLMSTHSASLLNAGVASVSHITMDGEHSAVNCVTSGMHPGP